MINDKAYFKMSAKNLDYAEKLGKADDVCIELDNDVIAKLNDLSQEHGVSLDAIVNGVLHLVVCSADV